MILLIAANYIMDMGEGWYKYDKNMQRYEEHLRRQRMSGQGYLNSDGGSTDSGRALVKVEASENLGNDDKRNKLL